MPARRVLPPTEEPLRLEEVKAYLKVEHDAEDKLIGSLIGAGRGYAEEQTERALAVQEWELTLDAFPCVGRPILLPRPPLLDVVSLTYIDASGAEVVLPPDAYVVDRGHLVGRVHVAWGRSWPALRRVPSAVRIRYRCGFALRPADGEPELVPPLEALPEEVANAIRLHVAHFYFNRAAAEPPRVVDTLLAPYVVPWIA